MGRDLPIEFPREALAAICRRYAVSRLSAFGSVLREDFAEGSDVDLLVEFEPGRTPGFAFFRLEEELTGLLGRRVHLNTRPPSVRTSVTGFSSTPGTSMSQHDPLVALRHLLDYGREAVELATSTYCGRSGRPISPSSRRSSSRS